MNDAERFEPEARDAHTALFPPALARNGFVFVSGQASVEEGSIVSGPFAVEMQRSMENLRAALSAMRLDLADIVKLTAYVDDTADLAEYNDLYPRYFPSHRPARTTLVGCLGGLVKFEVDAIAALRDSLPSRRGDPG